MKEKYIHFALAISKEAAKLSYAKKKKVGAVIMRDNNILSTGYNGTVTGSSNDCEYEKTTTHYNYCCDSCEGDGFEQHSDNLGQRCDSCAVGFIVEREEYTTKLVTSDEVIHAEENAILTAAKFGIPLQGTSIIVTDSPCTACARKIAQVGIKEVYFENFHDNGDGLKTLTKNGVKVHQIDKNLGIIPWEK
jgi:dCMP deaminase